MPEDVMVPVRIKTVGETPLRDQIAFATGVLTPGVVLAVPVAQAEREEARGTIERVPEGEQTPAQPKKTGGRRKKADPPPADENPEFLS